MSHPIQFEDEGGNHVRGGPCGWCDHGEDDEKDCYCLIGKAYCKGMVHQIYLGDVDDDTEDEGLYTVPIYDRRCDCCDYEFTND